MTRDQKAFYLIITIVAFLLALSCTARGEFGYGDVYWLDEETGEWIQDRGGDKASIERMDEGGSSLGNTNSISSILGTVIIQIDDNGRQAYGTSAYGQPAAFSLNGPEEDSPEYLSEDGIFKITAAALPGSSGSARWVPGERVFLLPAQKVVVKWQFTYEIVNNTALGMNVARVEDRFGPELAIESWTIETVPGNTANGTLQVNTTGRNSFEWQNIRLEPEHRARISWVVATRQNAAGERDDKGWKYKLNSGGKLHFTQDGVPGKDHRFQNDWQFMARISEENEAAISLEISTARIAWYIRRPGDFCAKAFDGVIRTGSPEIKVGVTFSEFGDLISEANQAIPVFYSLGTALQPGDWLTPSTLNGNVELELTAAAGTETAFSMWQRVVTGLQSTGTYHNKGVITFTLVNSQVHQAIDFK